MSINTINGPATASDEHLVFIEVLGNASGDPDYGFHLFQTEPDDFAEQFNNWRRELEVLR